MPRATTGLIHHKRQRKVLKDAKGFRGGRGVLYRTAKDARRKALQSSYIDRKRKKRDMKALWIARINAASRMFGTPYNRLMNGLQTNGVTLNRKMLADIAVRDITTFEKIVKQVCA